MTTPTTANAVAREAAWLATTANDTLPVLLAPAGPWQVVQAYWPGARLDVNKTGLYVLRTRLQDRRSGGIRLMPRYTFQVRIVWPVKNAVGSAKAGLAETEQASLDAACDLLLQRVRGLVRDKTHGGRFLSVGEAPSGQPPEIVWLDPEQTIPMLRSLRGHIGYVADDFEIND